MNNPTNNEFYSLAPSAWIYFFLRRAFHLLFLCLFLLLFFHGDPHGVRINGHPPTDDQVVTLSKLGSIVGFVCLGLISATCLYFWAFARSYSIELRPEGISVKYGVINLSGETLLFPKIQDIMIYRN